MERWQFVTPGSVAPGASEPHPAGTFSVIIAAFNASHVIGEAIESALAQTRPPHEIIVCDDGSTDELARALSPYGDSIVVVGQANGGEAAAKNHATRVATGEYVAILDADDVYEPERLEAMARLASVRPDLDIITTDAVLELDGQEMRRCYSPDNPFEVDHQELEILRRNFVFGLAAFRRTRFEVVGGFDESIRRTADWDLWLRMILSGSRVGLVAAPLARYRVGPDSLSADRAGMARGGLQTLEKAAGRRDLSPEAKAAVAEGVRWQRRNALEREAKEALRRGAPHVRRRSLAVALGPGFDKGTRAKALVAAVAPRLAGRRLQRTEPSWTGAGGVSSGTS